MIYGYIRVSTDRQTVENQRLEIEQWCERKHLVIEKWIEETISGTKSYSKGQFRGLIHTTLKKGDTLIVSELSRMSRKLFEIMEVLKFLMENEITLKTVKEGYELGDNITSKVLAFAFGLSAEIERTLISQRTKAGLAKRKSEGVIFGRPVGSVSKSLLDGKEEEIKAFLRENVALSGIARIFRVHRGTLNRFLRDNKIEYEKKEAPMRLENRDSEIEPYQADIEAIIKNGGFILQVKEHLKTTYSFDVSEGRLRNYLNRKGLYDTYLNVNTQLRAERNVDCGKYKNKR